MGLWSDIKGTTSTLFSFGIKGATVKTVSGALVVRDSTDNADAAITASKLNVSGNDMDINSDAAGSGADWKYSIARPASGMGEALTLTLPPTHGSSGQVLQTDGSGVTTWVAQTAIADVERLEETVVGFGASSPVAMFTLAAGAIVTSVEVILDTVFDGTAPVLSVGIAGTTGKFMADTQNDLLGSAKDRYVAYPGEAADVSSEDLIVTIDADDSEAGSARVIVYYSTPA